MMQAVHRLHLCGEVGLGLGDLRRQPAGIQPCEQLPLGDVIALLSQDCRHAFAAVERQFHLTQVHVAVQAQLRRALTTVQPPPERRSDNDDAGEEGSESRNLWHTGTYVCCS